MRLGLGLAAMFATYLAACAADGAAPPAPISAAVPESLCTKGETAYLHAVKPEANDAISVCVAEASDAEDARISVRWRRKDSVREWACKAKECGSVLEYQRYTRPLTTYLQLGFGNGELRYEIFEGLPGDDPDFDPDEPPTISVSASLQGQPEEIVMDEDYALLTERLGMMGLERFIEMKPM